MAARFFRRTVEVAKIFWTTFVQAEVTLLATSLAFSTIFALVPIIAVFMAVSKVTGKFWDYAQSFESEILTYVTAGAGEGLMNKFSMVLDEVNAASVGLIGFIGLLFTSVRMIYDLDTVILKIWHENRESQWWKRILIYGAIIVVSPAALSVAAGFLDWEVLNQFFSVFLTTSSVLILICLFICFKFTPPVRVSYSAAIVGAVSTYILLSLGKEIYTWATGNIFSYNKIYGSLAFLPLFLFWLFIIWCLILSGFIITKAIDDVFPHKGA